MADFGPQPPDDAADAKAPPQRATFFGTAYHRVSDRNQVAIPKHMLKRAEQSLEGPLLLLRLGEEGFLRLYTQRQLDAKFDEIRARSDLDAKTKSLLVRHLAAGVTPVEPDTQGRFVLPAGWVEQLGLQKEVAFCGAFNWIEIWPAMARRDAEATEKERTADAGRLIAEIMDS